MIQLDNKKLKKEFVNLDIKISTTILKVVLITFIVHNLLLLNCYKGSIDLETLVDVILDITVEPELYLNILLISLCIGIKINIMLILMKYYNNLKIAILIDENKYTMQEHSIIEIVNLQKLTNTVQYEVKLDNNEIISIISDNTINIGDSYYIFKLKVSKKKTITKAYNCKEYSI